MQHRINRRQFGIASAALGVTPFAIGQASEWPTAKPVRLIVAGAAGSITDIFARLFAEQYSKTFGQTFIVDNKAGANGAIANDYVAKAAPDGYTLLWSNAAAIAVNAALFPKLPYDTLKDLQPIAQVAATGNTLVVATDIPVKNLKEFVALIKANPGKYDYGSWGVGSGGHLTMEWLAYEAGGLKMNHVPYKSVPVMVQDMMAGTIKIAFMSPDSAQMAQKAGKAKPIAMSGTKRAPNIADVPTMTEQGYKFDIDSWLCLMAPAGTPMPIVRRLNEETNRLLQDPVMTQRLALSFNMPAPIKTVEQFTQTIRDDIETWSKVIKAANIKPET